MKRAFEWQVTTAQGDVLILTERQYEVIKEQDAPGVVYFADIAINPSFIVSAVKLPASPEFKSKYPCNDCFTTGFIKGKACPECGGTGMNIK